MADEGAVAVVEAPVVDTVDTPESTESTVDTKPEGEKQDNRKQPDALKKHVSDLRRRAESITDPVEKKAELDRIKFLYDTSGKARGYEENFPTVREAREVKALYESVGGKDGIANLQRVYSTAQDIDRKFEAGDPGVIEPMFKDAPEGMIKLAPMIFSHLEKANPEAYQKAVVPHAIKFLDTSGFPETFDSMVKAYQDGNKAEGDRLSASLARFVASQRQAGTPATPKTDPETERLRQELADRNKKDSDATVNRVYDAVNTHAGPVIDKFLKPIVKPLGLSAEQYTALRADAWKHLQDTRNTDETYKLTVNSKFQKNPDDAQAYMKGETESRAEAAARHVANFRYGHQLRNGAVKATPTTTGPVTPNVQQGREPSPSEVDYSAAGIAAVKKAGLWEPRRHKDMADVIMDGIAPMKGGGIRRWKK